MLTNQVKAMCHFHRDAPVSLLPWCIREGNRDVAFPEGLFFLRVYWAVSIEPFL